MAENEVILTEPSNKRKTSGKPKSIIWETYIIREKQISKKYWSATCTFCEEFWYKGSPTALENHLGNLYTKSSSRSS